MRLRGLFSSPPGGSTPGRDDARLQAGRRLYRPNPVTSVLEMRRLPAGQAARLGPSVCAREQDAQIELFRDVDL